MATARKASRFLSVFLLSTTLADSSFAQSSTVSKTGNRQKTAAVAPVLRPESREIATWPSDAGQRTAVDVVFELSINDAGNVVRTEVIGSAGASFDSAASQVVSRYRFEPARIDGKAVASIVQFTYEFRNAPPAPAPPSPAQTAPRNLEPVQSGADQSTLVLAQRPMSAASSAAVRDRDFQLRPIATVADILRVTPGLLVVQHAGGGKANQYFLRGFDADHGTDIAFSLDGIPINMVSHGHGQGYTDTNFMIPEIVERIEISKGPYFADQGDFATAGAVNLVSRKNYEHSSVGFGVGGSPGYGGPMYRGLLIASPKIENAVNVHPLFAAEIGRNNGPFETQERFDRYKLYSKATLDLGTASSVSLGFSSYAGDWYGSGQVAQRAVRSGQLSRFGTHDNTEGGASARHQAFASYKLRPNESSEFQMLAYLAQYRLNIYSNFTLFRDNESQGDGILQRDRRTFFGGKTSFRTVKNFAGIRFDTTIGGSVRSDDIDTQLDRQAKRQVISALRDNRVGETSMGAFVKEDVTLTTWLRGSVGGRADFFSFTVDDRLEAPGSADGATSGTKGASQVSPKLSVIMTPLSKKGKELELYLNYGHGFHSNDARSVVLGNGAGSPLTRALGAEVGARTRLFERLDLAVSAWQLNLESETVWIGDEGTTEAGDPTRRLGLELETRFAITKWLTADLDFTATKSRLTQNAGNGASVALAPIRTWAGGLSARHPSGIRGGMRFYGVSDRPATQDYPAPGSLVADGFTVFDLHAGYKHKRFDVSLDVENLFGAAYKSAQFATTSRLRTEPSTNAPAPPGTCSNGSRTVTSATGNFGGCEDINFTPGYPFTLRLMTTLYLN
jgi:TonB family protein